jgi:hypothetical protein
MSYLIQMILSKSLPFSLARELSLPNISGREQTALQERLLARAR